MAFNHLEKRTVAKINQQNGTKLDLLWHKKEEKRLISYTVELNQVKSTHSTEQPEKTTDDAVLIIKCNDSAENCPLLIFIGTPYLFVVSNRYLCSLCCCAYSFSITFLVDIKVSDKIQPNTTYYIRWY